MVVSVRDERTASARSCTTVISSLPPPTTAALHLRVREKNSDLRLARRDPLYPEARLLPLAELGALRAQARLGRLRGDAGTSPWAHLPDRS